MDLVVILILNGVILLAITSLNFVWGRKSISEDKRIQVIYGLVFGVTTILLMNLAWGSDTGVFYDSRTVLIAVVGAFYSIYTTIIMVIIGSIYRIILGGPGAIAGVVTIVCTALLGYLFKRYVRPKIKKHDSFYFLLFGFVVHVFMLLYHFVLPMDIDFIIDRIHLIYPVVLTIYPLFVLVLSKIIASNDNRLIAQENLSESEERYRLLFNSISTGIIHFDDKGVILECNDKFALIMNTAKKNLIGLDMNVLPNEQFKAVLHEVLEGKSSLFHGEYQSYLSGKELYLNALFNPIFKDGHLDGGVAIVTDITESTQMKRKITEIANKDLVTNLYNRKAFEEDTQSDKFDDKIPLEFRVISIDNLQFYIDTMGYQDSEKLLMDFANCLTNNYYDDSCIYRISLNDFAVIRPHDSEELSEAIIKKLKKKIKSIEGLTTPLQITSVSVIKDTNEKNWFNLSIDLRNRIRTIRTHSNSVITKNSIDVLMASLFEKSPREKLHSERVSKLAYNLGKKVSIGAENLDKLRSAAILHDIGKLNIESSILEKDSKLTKKEYKSVKDHSESGARILASVPEYEDLSKIVLAHHEHYDGSGYPFGLKDEQIPVESRIISIVDAFDAMMNDRPYRKALTKERAIKELLAHSGTQFDPKLVDEFVTMIKI